MHFSIGQLSKKSGVSIDTIRYYEKVGLLNPAQRDVNNYRIYSETTLNDLLFIKHCRELDITLDDIKTLKNMATKPTQTCHQVDELIHQYLEDVSAKIERLYALKTTLVDLKQQCSDNSTIDQCGILKELHAN